METSSVSFRLGYRPSLDGFRAVAILLVMGFHAKVAGMGGAFVGVDLFFVLSGFLITTLLIQEYQRHGTIDLRRFYIRRALRLLPALMVVIVVLLVLCALLNRTAFSDTTRASLLVLGYLANWSLVSDPYGLRLFTHAWSLSMEEQFYIAFPLVLCLATYRPSLRHLQILVLVIIAGINALRIALVVNGASWYRIYYGMDTHADALLWGCWLGITMTTTTQWRSPFWQRWSQRAMAPAIIALGMFCVAANSETATHFVVVFPAVALCATLIVFYLVTAPRTAVHQLLESPLLVGIGKVSYGLYLWHFPIYQTMLLLDIPSPQVALYGTPLTIGMTLASYYLIEKPCLRLSAHITGATPPTFTLPVPPSPTWRAERSEAS